MEYNERQKADFKQQFRVRQKRQIILAISLVALLVAFVAFVREGSGAAFLGVPSTIAGPGFLVLVVGATVFSLLNWRCPACNCYLGKAMSPRFCQKCGVALQ